MDLTAFFYLLITLYPYDCWLFLVPCRMPVAKFLIPHNFSHVYFSAILELGLPLPHMQKLWFSFVSLFFASLHFSLRLARK